ncbi:MAG: hypothetical protein PHU79_02850 [Oscillospiraceae bacterium]|nr:hypothetical protein [Oscillospiraceae bacterium]
MPKRKDFKNFKIHESWPQQRFLENRAEKLLYGCLSGIPDLTESTDSSIIK